MEPCPHNNDNTNSDTPNNTSMESTVQVNDTSKTTVQQTMELPERSLLDNDKENAEEEDQESPAVASHKTQDSLLLLETYVQQANRVQSLMATAWQKATKRRPTTTHDKPSEPKRRRRLADQDSLVFQMAHNKTEQILQLQQQLQSLQTELAALQSTNATLRTETETQRQRHQRTSEALRVAQRNASQARADADAAETTAANLAQTLETLQAVVRETQDETKQLAAAHQDIQRQSTTLQADLWRKQVRIACVEREHDAVLQDLQALQRAQSDWKQEKTRLQESMEEKDRKIGSLERQWNEQRALDEARQQRMTRLEEEWREAQNLLVEATASQSAAAETQSQLRSDMRTVQQKNEELYERLTKTQEKARHDRERHEQALQKAEQDGHEWHVQLENAQDQNERLRMEKTNLEKQVTKLKAQVATKSVTLPEKTPAFSSVSPASEKTPASLEVTPKDKSSESSSTRNKENGENAPRRPSIVPAGCCVFCGKNISGLTKKCQCDNPSCDLRAHFACLQKQGSHKSVGLSVAHPGLPLPKTPFVLCTAPTTTTTGNSN